MYNKLRHFHYFLLRDSVVIIILTDFALIKVGCILLHPSSSARHDRFHPGFLSIATALGNQFSLDQRRSEWLSQRPRSRARPHPTRPWVNRPPLSPLTLDGWCLLELVSSRSPCPSSRRPRGNLPAHVSIQAGWLRRGSTRLRLIYG